MKFTSGALSTLSCIQICCAFVQHAPFQNKIPASLTSHVEKIKQGARFNVMSASSEDEMLGLFGEDDDMFGLFEDGEDEENEELKKKLAIYRDADIIFSLLDTDGNASLSMDEVSDHLTVAGYEKKVIKQIFDKMDVNKDNAISKEEFRDGMVLIEALQTAPGLGKYNAQYVKEIYEDADQVFQSADADGNGEIEEFELKSHMKRTLPKYSDEAIRNIFRTLDKDGDKSISQKELREAFLQCSALRQTIGEGPNFK